MELFKATELLLGLAHEVRLEIFKTLIRYGDEGLAVNQILDMIKIPPATMSFHLSHLKRVGLLRSEKSGRSIRYVANYQSMSKLLTFLSENCCVEGESQNQCKN